MKRVYYSAYIPVGHHPILPGPDRPVPLLREHRLYQADWLLRFYRFDADEIVDSENPNLDLNLDPKCAWALRHPELFPVDINSAEYELLLRVPGIGVTSARRIIEARRHKKLDLDDMRKMGCVIKRAIYFVTAKGRFAATVSPDSPILRDILSEGTPYPQMSLFDTPSTPLLQGGSKLSLSDSTRAALQPVEI